MRNLCFGFSARQSAPPTEKRGSTDSGLPSISPVPTPNLRRTKLPATAVPAVVDTLTLGFSLATEVTPPGMS